MNRTKSTTRFNLPNPTTKLYWLALEENCLHSHYGDLGRVTFHRKKRNDVRTRHDRR